MQPVRSQKTEMGKRRSATGSGAGMQEPAGGQQLPDAPDQNFVGLVVEKYFKGHGKFSGVVVRFHARKPPQQKEDLWTVRYDDGDEEDYSWRELCRLLKAPEQEAPEAGGDSDGGRGMELEIATLDVYQQDSPRVWAEGESKAQQRRLELASINSGVEQRQSRGEGEAMARQVRLASAAPTPHLPAGRPLCPAVAPWCGSPC